MWAGAMATQATESSMVLYTTYTRRVSPTPGSS